MTSIAMYVAMHKPYQSAADEAYIPIQVGAAGREAFTVCRDDTGENISAKNPSYCELTALYWMWKHAEADVVGLVHYRRYFAAGRGRDPWQRIMSGDELQARLKDVDVLLPGKRHYVIETTYSQYAHAHHEKDLTLTRQVIAERCPAYLDAFDQVMAQRSGHRFNMFVMRRELMNRYCGWLFPLLEELESRIDTTGYDAYNRRVIGFLAERLLDVWLTREGLRCHEIPVVSMEKVNWFQKGWAFFRRKMVGTFGKK